MYLSSLVDQVNLIKQMQEKYSLQKEFWLELVDLEKAFDRVSCAPLGWALRYVRLEEWIVSVVNSMYAGVTTAVKLKNGFCKEFDLRVGVHQGSVLRPLLFIIVVETLSSSFIQGLPW